MESKTGLNQIEGTDENNIIETLKKNLQQNRNDRFKNQDVTITHYWEALPYPITCKNSKQINLKSVIELQVENKFNFNSSFDTRLIEAIVDRDEAIKIAHEIEICDKLKNT